MKSFGNSKTFKMYLKILFLICFLYETSAQATRIAVKKSMEFKNIETQKDEEDEFYCGYPVLNDGKQVPCNGDLCDPKYTYCADGKCCYDCPNGQPLLLKPGTGFKWDCGLVGTRCPIGYFCHVHPLDHFANCCKKDYCNSECYCFEDSCFHLGFDYCSNDRCHEKCGINNCCCCEQDLDFCTNKTCRCVRKGNCEDYGLKYCDPERCRNACPGSQCCCNDEECPLFTDCYCMNERCSDREGLIECDRCRNCPQENCCCCKKDWPLCQIKENCRCQAKPCDEIPGYGFCDPRVCATMHRKLPELSRIPNIGVFFCPNDQCCCKMENQCENRRCSCQEKPCSLIPGYADCDRINCFKSCIYCCCQV